MKKANVLMDIPCYNGPAIYALIDDSGKKYIGSTSDFQRRIKTWQAFMRKALKEGSRNGLLPHAITDALLAGKTFRVAVIEELPRSMCFRDRVAHERTALAECGGLCSTYNEILPSCKGLKANEGAPIKNGVSRA